MNPSKIDNPFRARKRAGLGATRKYDGIAIRLVDLNQVFETSSITPVILNTFNVNSTVDKEILDSLIYTHYEGDSLNVIPECQCRYTRGAGKINSVCPRCGNTVLPVSERPLISLLWMTPPEGVETFINPQAWTMLSKALTHGGINALEWLCDPYATLGSEPHREIRKIVDLGIERGINYFYRNFDEIIDKLFDAGVIAGTSRRQREDLYQFIQLNRQKIFTKYLPIPSRMAFVTERSTTGSFADMTMKPAIDAIRTISATVYSLTPLDQKRLQAHTVRANSLMAQYHQDFMNATLASKKGWLRKHTYGSPLRFTFRAVISSLSERHEYDELHIPWGVAVTTYAIHLTSKLYRRNNPDTGKPFTPNEALQHLSEHTLKYSPLLDELFQEMLAECPHKGLPCLLNRNPSLDRGSIQQFYITKINPDPNINAIAMSVLCLIAPNAD